MSDFLQNSINFISSSLNKIRSYNAQKEDNNDNEKNLKNKVNKITIIVGSTNFYFNFNGNGETIPVLLLIRGKKIFYGNQITEKYLDKESMIFYDFLYYLDLKYENSKEILNKRNIDSNNDLSFSEEILDKIVSFNYMYLEEKEKDDKQTDKNNRREINGKKEIESLEKPKYLSVENRKNLTLQSYDSEQLLKIYTEYFIEEKLNNVKDEYYSLNLILPLYLNDIQKEKIKNIFLMKLDEKNLSNNLNDFDVMDEMSYYLQNLNRNFENKIIFIHFGGSSLVIILYDCGKKNIIKKKEKLIGGIDIDIKLTKDSLAKFKNESNGIKIMDITLIYKVKNLIEEGKKNYIQIIMIK